MFKLDPLNCSHLNSFTEKLRNYLHLKFNEPEYLILVTKAAIKLEYLSKKVTYNGTVTLKVESLLGLIHWLREFKHLVTYLSITVDLSEDGVLDFYTVKFITSKPEEANKLESELALHRDLNLKEAMLVDNFLLGLAEEAAYSNFRRIEQDYFLPAFLDDIFNFRLDLEGRVYTFNSNNCLVIDDPKFKHLEIPIHYLPKSYQEIIRCVQDIIASYEPAYKKHVSIYRYGKVSRG